MVVHPYQQNAYVLLSISISRCYLRVPIPKILSVFTWLEIFRENLVVCLCLLFLVLFCFGLGFFVLKVA